MTSALRMFGIALIAVNSWGCGGGGNSAAPTPQIPNVAGAYSGNTTITFPELGETLSCPTTVTVTQSGNTVNFSPMILGGACDNLSLPLGQTTIDTTGALPGQGAMTFDEPSCGRYSAVASGGFFGRSLQMSMTATSSTCVNFNLTINVTR